jgi:hypothetical protein
MAWGSALRWDSSRLWRRMVPVAAVMLAGSVAPRAASAENLFDLLFGGLQQLQQRAASPQASFTDPFGINQPPAPLPRVATGGAGPAFCVRSCDGRYFPLSRGNATPIQLCQAFCPASPTTVFYGSTIDDAVASTGQRYADSANAYAYRKTLRADCTCNGRDPAGLAPVDLTLDGSLRPGDVIATSDGLVAYSGGKFSPVASYPGLTPEVRARLGEMKVAPASTPALAAQLPPSEATTPPATMAPKPSRLAGRHAEAD